MKSKSLLFFIAIVLVLAAITTILVVSSNSAVGSPVGNLLLIGGMFLFGWTIVILNRFKNADHE